MNLPKAIEILDLNVKSVGNQMPTDTLLAVLLLINAAKRLLLARSYGDKHTLQLLPGED